MILFEGKFIAPAETGIDCVAVYPAEQAIPVSAIEDWADSIRLRYGCKIASRSTKTAFADKSVSGHGATKAQVYTTHIGSSKHLRSRLPLLIVYEGSLVF